MGNALLILLWVISIESLLFSFLTPLKTVILPFVFVALIIAALLTALKPNIQKKISVLGCIVGILISLAWEVPVVIMNALSSKNTVTPNVIPESADTDSIQSASDNANALTTLYEVVYKSKFKVFTVTDALDKTKLPPDSLYLSAVHYDSTKQTLELSYRYPRKNTTLHVWEAPTNQVSKDIPHLLEYLQ